MTRTLIRLLVAGVHTKSGAALRGEGGPRPPPARGLAPSASSKRHFCECKWTTWNENLVIICWFYVKNYIIMTNKIVLVTGQPSGTPGPHCSSPKVEVLEPPLYTESASHPSVRRGVRWSAKVSDGRPPTFDPASETSVSADPAAEARRREPADEDAGVARRWTPPPAPVKSPAARGALPTPVQPVSNSDVFSSFIKFH